MTLPDRQRRLARRHALVDKIPYVMPINSEDSPALMAGFTVDFASAAGLLPSDEVHLIRLPRDRALLMITVIDYRTTDVGKYVEFSIALACTHGHRPRGLLPAVVLQRRSGTGQLVVDLPVSSKISVKGGKGIWGMPKHQANLDFRVDDLTMSSQYDLDGKLCMRVTVERPSFPTVRLKDFGAVNYCAFRGLLMKSSIYFSDRVEVAVGPFAKATLLLGDHSRMDRLRVLDISSRPIFTACLPHSHGVLDDHFEAWFLTSDRPYDPARPPEGLESVVDLPNDQSWLPPPTAAGR